MVKQGINCSISNKSKSNLLLTSFIQITILLVLISTFNISVTAQGRFGTTPSTPTNSSQPSNILRYIPIETSQRFGIQQVGEVGAQISRQNVKPVASGPEALVSKAELLVERGEVSRAIELYRKAIAIQPKLYSAYTGLGHALLESGDFDAAATEFEKVVKHNPNNSEAYLNWGVSLYRAGHIRQAIVQYQHAIAEQKQLPTAYFNLAMAYAHQGDFDRAINHYQIALEQRKNYPEVYNNLGLIYEAMGNPEMASRQFRIALEQRKGAYPLAHYNLARLYSSEKKYAEAIAEFQLAIKQQSSFAEAYLDLGNIYLIRTILMDTEELDKTISAYRQAIKLRGNNYPLAHENLAIALTKQGKKEEALAQYRIAFDQYGGRYPETLSNLVATLLNKNSFLIGNELSRPDNAGNLSNKNDETKLDERIGLALEAYAELDEALKDSANVRYCAGHAYATAKDWQSALNEFARAIELSGNKDLAAREAFLSILSIALYL